LNGSAIPLHWPRMTRRRILFALAAACSAAVLTAAFFMNAMVSNTVSDHRFGEEFELRKGRMGRDGHVAYVGRLTLELGGVPAAGRADLLVRGEDYAEEGPAGWVAEPSADGLPTKFRAQDDRVPVSVSVGQSVEFRQHRISLLLAESPALPWAPLTAKVKVERIPCSDEQFAAVPVGGNPTACHPVLDASDDGNPGVVRISAPRRAVSGPKLIGGDFRTPPSAYARVMVAGTWHIKSSVEARKMAGNMGWSYEQIELVVRDLARPQDAPSVLRPENMTHHGERAFQEPHRWPNPPEPERAYVPGEPVSPSAHGGWFAVDLGPYVAREPNAKKTVTVQARWFDWVSEEATVEIGPR